MTHEQLTDIPVAKIFRVQRNDETNEHTAVLYHPDPDVPFNPITIKIVKRTYWQLVNAIPLILSEDGFYYSKYRGEQDE